MKCVSSSVILVFLISLARCFENAVKLHKSILIKLLKLVVRYHILIGVKIVEIAEAVSCGVSNLTVVVGDLLKNFGADTNICVIICGSNPQTKNICAVFVDNLLRCNTVSERL